MYIHNKSKFEEKSSLIKKFIDFKRDDKTFYNNYYISDFKIVVKIPLIEKDKHPPGFKIERFSLIDDVYLTTY